MHDALYVHIYLTGHATIYMAFTQRSYNIVHSFSFLRKQNTGLSREQTQRRVERKQ